MTSLLKYITYFIFLLVSSSLIAQSYTATVVSAQTGEPIPYATVQLSSNSGTITNEEGVFSIGNKQLEKLKDSIFISSMGYHKLSLYPVQATDTILTLNEKFNELDNVFLTTQKLNPEEIIEKVEENLSKNYPSQYTSQKLFFRQTLSNEVNKVKVDFKKSTIKELDKELIDSIVRQIPRASEYYSESVGTLYGNYNDQKIHVAKAAKLYDKSKDVSFEGFGKRLEKIFKENVKPDSYLKIKSGWLSEKIPISEINEDDNPQDTTAGIHLKAGEDPTIQDITSSVKSGISRLYKELFFQEDSKLDFLQKSNRYEFTQTAITSMGEDIVYVLSFKPKGSKDFSGTIYVNTDDFAIMRLDFHNIKKLYGLKLFGIGYRDIVYKGTSMFTKNKNGGYALAYMELERGVEMMVDRPLTVIEKNKHVKGRRKQNELDLNIDFKITATSKSEFVVFHTAAITEEIYKSSTDSKDVEATYLSAYDPNFWEDHTVIEPNSAIQKFKVVK
ncbi:carboxypeptidase-like regulatory domain-containing protein [Dokdonia sp. Hel_I_53]|uniref:carboxypeptidase-like regulatory domain-containing protein n=1 Tax=Dokdonia sp. Hel_I_53 TaxID=1566287 RepID=UPI00119A7E08|nr:carboxypeptidase-like regulatory domain-containing protein [Dokdonia sp. Hel_I_53]TVZ52413.1 carboxypeptidase-like protein [Dokdonia sp. Hel_I_53]